MLNAGVRPNLTTEALFQELRSIKGVGAYSAGNILKLLGRYDYLGLDSWYDQSTMKYIIRQNCERPYDRTYI